MQQQKAVNNEIYKTSLVIGAGFIKQLIWYFTNVIIFRNPLVVSNRLKVTLLKCFGAKVGKGVVLKPSVNIKFPWKLTIGNYSWIGESVWIDNLSEVHIGEHVTISQGALLLTGSHDFTKETFDLITRSIVLEDGVWIGARGIVYGGAICKSHAILGMNSVAVGQLNPYTIYKGNPAVPIKIREIK
jgi:putative colanic acid biosynthesis acetyltransferase WcaF